jgi:hypothetical protein
MTNPPSAADAYVRQTRRAVVFARVLLVVIFVVGAIWAGTHLVQASKDAGLALRVESKMSAAHELQVQARGDLVATESDLQTAQAVETRSSLEGGPDLISGLTTAEAEKRTAETKVSKADTAVQIANGTHAIDVVAEGDQVSAAFWIIGGTVLLLLIVGGVTLALTLTAGRARAMVALARET